MFTTDNVKEVTVGTVTLTGTVHLDSLIITSIVDADDGIVTKVDGGLYTTDIENIDINLPISLTLEKSGDLKWHSVAGMAHGEINIKSNPDFMATIGDNLMPGLLSGYAKKHKEHIISMDKEAGEAYLMEVFYNDTSASPKARDIMNKALTTLRA